jgi:Zn-dependent protease
VITARIAALGERMVKEPAQKPKETPRPAWTKGGGVLGGLGLLLWKLKVVLVLFLTKFKLILLGLTKLSTLGSMLLFFGVYWTRLGWPFAAGLVVSLYIHEMGHVIWLSRYGIKAGAPMFIPGFGALVRLKQYPPTPGLDARVGLAGPLYGLGAAAVAYGLYAVTGAPIWGAISRMGAWLNLFNLIPFWSLDGGRGFRGLTKKHRWVATAFVLAAWLVARDGVLLLIAIAGVMRCLAKDAPEKEDLPVLAWYTALIIGLSMLASVPAADFAVIAR